MKLKLDAVFRQSTASVKETMPGDLAYLQGWMRDFGGGRPTMPLYAAISAAPIDESGLDRVIEWGQQKLNDMSNIAGITITDEYDRDDLSDEPAVEVFVPNSIQNGSDLKNLDAIVGTRTCSTCDRADWEVVAPLEVKPARGSNMQMVNYDYDGWIVSDEIANVLEMHAVKTAELTKTPGHRQVVLHNECLLDISVEPIRVSDWCPDCGLPKVVLRSDLISGPGFSDPSCPSPEMNVHRVRPLTVALPRSDWAFAQSNHVLGRFDDSHAEPYVVGQSLYLGQNGYPRPRAYVVSQALYRDLGSVGVKGVAFRPVNVV